jgi:LysM repeat protein
MKQLCLTSLLVLVLLVAAACASPTPTPRVVPIQPAATPTATAAQSPAPVRPIPTSTPTAEPTTLPSATPTAPPTVQPTPCGQPAGWPAYTIQAGDTLFSIAYNTGTSVDQLKLANCLQGDTIYAGQPLFVPFIPYVPPAVDTFPSMPQVSPPQGAVVQPELGSAPRATFSPPVQPELGPAPSPGEPRMNIDPGRGRAGLAFTLVITGFQPLEIVTVAIESSTGVAVDNFTVPMNGDGASNYLWQSRADLKPGFYEVTLTRSDGTPGPGGTILIVP